MKGTRAATDVETPDADRWANPKALLAELGLDPKKSFGQHFLRDRRALEVIAAEAAAPRLPIIEIGAGLGALTWHLSQHGLPVTAVERDRDLVPALRRLFAAHENVDIVEADAATLDFQVAARLPGPFTLAGNLPYQLTAPLLMRVFKAPRLIAAAVFMVQREVALRIVAGPGGRERSSLGVWAELAGGARRVLELGPGAFLPPPKVRSTVISMRIDAACPLARIDTTGMERLLRLGFGQRRKMLRNSLRPAHPDIEALLTSCGIAATSRAEDLDGQAWLALLARLHPQAEPQ